MNKTLKELVEPKHKITRKERRFLRKEEREEKKLQELDDMISKIDINHYESSTKRREISIFCTTLFSHMRWKHRLMFVIKGYYSYPLQKTYEEIMKRKSKAKIKAEKEKLKADKLERIRKDLEKKDK